ncbi:terpene synthase family protein [Kitasatospora purpeofusca]|uniref:terpene synthase family protein n=1 Tax=Kitasatospora purpeofusca TaxID=67352 RepID=UPI003865F153
MDPYARLSTPAPPVEENPGRARRVEVALEKWAAEAGIADYLGEINLAGFGRMMCLANPRAASDNHLLVLAKCFVAEYITDDTCEDNERGVVPADLYPQLMLGTFTIEPTVRLTGYAAEWDKHTDSSILCRAWRGAIASVHEVATPAQAGRLKHALATLFIGFGGESGWRLAGRTPPSWEYLMERQLNSFFCSMILPDVAAGYELPPQLYYLPDVQRALRAAALSSNLMNDVYSLWRDLEQKSTAYSLPLLLAAEQGIALDAAVERTIDLHNDLIAFFRTESVRLTTAHGPVLGRYLSDILNWLAVNRHWHVTSDRYRMPA